MIAKESPLEGMNMGTVATLAIRELPGLHTIDLRVAPGTSTFASVSKALAVDLPVKVGQFTGMPINDGTKGYALCLALDWWLLVGIAEVVQNLQPLRSN